MHVQLLIPAAGMGARMGLSGPKALLDLAGKPLLVRTLERFRPLALVSGAVVIIPAAQRQEFKAVLERAFPDDDFTLIDGGAERQISVSNGLRALSTETEIVVIHDAARPFVPPSSVTASIEAADTYGAATVAIPSVDTILVADDAQCLVETPDRRRLWACQTPQTFRVEVIRDAHDAAARDDYIGTDDASLVRRNGGVVRLVQGSPLNFKITTPLDHALAECVVKGALA